MIYFLLRSSLTSTGKVIELCVASYPRNKPWYNGSCVLYQSTDKQNIYFSKVIVFEHRMLLQRSKFVSLLYWSNYQTSRCLECQLEIGSVVWPVLQIAASPTVGSRHCCGLGSSAILATCSFSLKKYAFPLVLKFVYAAWMPVIFFFALRNIKLFLNEMSCGGSLEWQGFYSLKFPVENFLIVIRKYMTFIISFLRS